MEGVGAPCRPGAAPAPVCIRPPGPGALSPLRAAGALPKGPSRRPRSPPPRFRSCACPRGPAPAGGPSIRRVSHPAGVVPLRSRAWSRPSGVCRGCVPPALPVPAAGPRVRSGRARRGPLPYPAWRVDSVLHILYTFCWRRQNDTLSFCKVFCKNACHFDIFPYLCGTISAHVRHVAGTAQTEWVVIYGNFAKHHFKR